MNKGQLIGTLANHFDGNRRAAQHALESVLDTITREIARGEKVSITGFGSFEKKVRPARMVRNPRTQERSRAKKTAVPRFRPGAELKAVVSGEKKLPRAAAASSGPAKKAGAKKSTAKKSTAKSTAAKRSGKKTSAKRGTARRSTAKRS